MSLEDLFSDYPDLNNLDFQTIISNKKEFSDLKSGLSEETPKVRGGMFSHQKAVVRHLLKYDDLLITFEPGVGKTCITPFLTEILKAVNPYRARKTYIIVKSSLIQEITQQIVCTCTSGLYDPSPDVKEDQMHKSSRNKLREQYKIMSYDEFATFFNDNYVIKKNKKSELDVYKINEDFDGCIFWIDEIHYLSMEEKFKMTECFGTDETSDVSGMETEQRKVDESGLNKKTKKRVYCAIWNIFHTARKIKRILTTGTPLVNNPSEFGPLMNLILPRDLQFSDKLSNQDWNNMTLDDLAPYLNGRVSYIRAKESKAIPKYIGQEIILDNGNLGHTIVYPTLMGDIQEQSYINNKGDEKDVESKGFGISSRQIANFVYPDESFADKGFNKYITKNGKWWSINSELLSYFQDIDKLSLLSGKFADISRRLVGGTFTDPETQDVVTRPSVPGIFFIYSDYIKSSIVPLALILQTLGMERFEGSDSVFRSTISEKKKAFCQTKGPSESRTIMIEKRPRFAILTADTKDNAFENIMELLNSYENRHGEYLKALLSSQVGKEGININNCLNVELIDSEWNLSNIFQEESRAIRANSHDYLIEELTKNHDHLLTEQRERLIQLGVDPDSVDTGKIFINIRRHCAVGSREPIEGSSINLKMYRDAEEKDIPIKKLFRKIKQLSIDCQLHYERNVRPNDVDGSSQCDYQICRYECYGNIRSLSIDKDKGKNMSVDRSTYDIFFLDEILLEIQKEIQNILKKQFSITIKELLENLKIKDVNEKYLKLAIYKLIKDKNVIYDRYGFQMYLYESGDRIFLGHENDVITLEYIEKINLLSQKKIQTQIDISETENVDLGNLSIKSRIELVERALVSLKNFKYLKGPEISEQDARILDYFKFFWFEFNKPEKEIQKSYERSMSKTKQKKNIHKRYKTIELSKETSKGDPTFVHKMNSFNEIEKGTEYNLMAQIQSGDILLRILDLNADEFRDVQDYELPEYDKLIQKEYRLRVNKPLLGLLFKDKFRIVDRTGQSEKDIENQRKSNRGRVAGTIDAYLLANILWKISKIKSVDDIKFKRRDLNRNKRELIDNLVKKTKFTREDLNDFEELHLIFLYDVLNDPNVDKTVLADIILEKMIEKDLIIRIL